MGFAKAVLLYRVTLQNSQWGLILMMWHYPGEFLISSGRADFSNLTQNLGLGHCGHYCYARIFLEKLPWRGCFTQNIMSHFSKVFLLRHKVMPRLRIFPSLRNPYNVIGIKICHIVSSFWKCNVMKGHIFWFAKKASQKDVGANPCPSPYGFDLI